MRKFWYAGYSLPLLVNVALYPMAAYSEEITSKSPSTNITQLDKFVVTTEMIERPLSESGHSTAIYSEDKLQNQAGLVTLRDVLDVTPNVSMVTGTGKAPTIRGVDGTGPAENAIAFFAGSRSRLSWQIDGRPASYNEIAFSDMSLFDVERIEILRGPQSTLVGRNAIAGTMVVKTKDPLFDVKAAAQYAFGNDHQRRRSAMLNIPVLDDVLAFRLVADGYERESAVNYQSYPGVSDPGQMDALSLRAKMLFQPTKDPDARLLLTAAHSDFEGPNGEIIARPFDELVSNFPQQPVHQPRTTSLVADMSMPLSDNFDLELISSYTDLTFLRKAVPNTTNARIETSEYVIEPRLRYQADNGLKGVVGLYFYRARQDEFIELGNSTFDDETDTFATYTEGVIPLSENIDLSLGFRYEREERQRVGGDATGMLIQVASDETYEAFMPKFGINWRPSDNTSFGAMVSRGYNAGGSGVTLAAFPVVNFDYDAEYVWTYELYGRQEFSEGRISATQNIFFSEYDDMQLPFDLTPDNSQDEAFIVRNADRVKTWGAELGLNVAVTEKLDWFGNVGLLETEITKFSDSGVEGNDLQTAPNVTANSGLTWKNKDFSASTVARYSDAYYSDVNNRPRGKTDPYVVVDAQLSWQFKHLRVFGTVKNIFDNDKPVARSANSNPALETEVQLQSRLFMVGLQLDY
ncbi:TonB-dependent receptor [Methylophaga sp. UBA2689]|jgi:iron complex outermembrane recepter protein|uniref:TonB-dependent receptor n=1 Tax=Methylophaga sp. UBA2689 TaxID=1946878 RepID=UPI0025DC799C|nr:TonB-dependent receptor [Methylophaga sp. UBA2689]|tara:strand:- start:14344 stop:16416 length:2073 start_codon:yes stop_codon:yes gene_type:complete